MNTILVRYEKIISIANSKFLLFLFFILPIHSVVLAQPDRWVTKSSDNFDARWGASAVTFNNKIYVFGGSGDVGIGNSGTYIPYVEVYDPVTDRWTNLLTT